MQTLKRYPKTPSSELAKERYKKLLDCTEILLNDVLPENLGIPEVAKKAELPPQAVYRLFPSSAALIHGLASRYMAKMRENQTEEIAEQTRLGRFKGWQEALAFGLRQGAAYYQNNPHAMELILGAGVSRECRAADRENTRNMADRASTVLGELAGVTDPDMLISQIEIMLDISDAIWSHSYFHHRDITEYYLQESIRASTAYLALYLPTHLLRTSI